MRASRFGVRNENQQQQLQMGGGKAALAAKPAVRNPLGEIRRRPLQPLSVAVAAAAAPAQKENCRPVEDESQKMEIDEEVEEAQIVQCKPLQQQQQICSGDDASLLVLYQQVVDVDILGEDSRDAQLVSCYAKEIFDYLRSLETTQLVRRDYLCLPAKRDITPRMHRILFDWLVQVHHRYGLLPETLYMALHIVDYYMTLDGSDITKANYQLLGITALFLACKFEEIYPPDLYDFVSLTERACTEAQVCSMERSLLVGMDYFFGYPQPILFLRRYSRVSGATAEIHDAAKFLAELGRCSYDLVHLPPSGLAAAAFCLAVDLLATAARPGVLPRCWLPELEVFSGYSRAALLPALRLLAKTVLQAYNEKQKYTAVRKKYESRSFQMVSSFPEFSDQASPVLLGYTSGGSNSSC